MNTGINPGAFRNKVTFQKFNGTVDSSGDVRDDVDENWIDFKRTDASVDPISGKEFYAAEQSQSEVTHKIRCRYFKGLKAEMRILWNDRGHRRIFRIVSVLDWQEAHRSFLIMATELVE